MYALKLSPLGWNRGMETKGYSICNDAGRVSVVFSWVLFCTSLHKGYVLQKLVLPYIKLYITKFSCALFLQ